MAASGTIKTDFRTGYRLQIVWTVDSQSTENNTSTVTAKVQLVSLGSSYTISSSASKSGSLTIDGTKYNFTFTAALSGNQTKTLFTKTATINHLSDGTKSCSMSATCALNVTLSGSDVGNVTATGIGIFDTIPRASTPTLSSQTHALGDQITIQISRASTAFTHTLKYKFGNASGTIATGVTTTSTWTIPLSLASQIPNSVTGKGTVICETYSGTTFIGTKQAAFTASVPASVVPSISEIVTTEASAGIAEKFGAYIQGQSKLSVSVSAAGVYGSTITGYKTLFGGISYSTSAFITDLLTASGDIEISATVTDSRGRTATLKKTINVLPYTSPQVTLFRAYRCDSAGTANDEGLYLKAEIAFQIANLDNKNDKTYSVEYKETEAAEWTTLESGGEYEYNSTILSSSEILADNKAYTVRLTVSDYFHTAAFVTNIPTAFTLFDIHVSGKGFSFGKVAEYENLFDMGFPARFRSQTHFDGALTYNTQIVNTGSINDITTSGKYYLSSGVTDKPANQNGWLEVQKYNDQYVYQRYVTYAGKVFERIKAAGTWQDWCGTFTSGIWTYTKKMDGTVECVGNMELTGVEFTTKVADSWYRPANTYPLTYPVTFTKNPQVIFSTSISSSSGTVLTYLVGQTTASAAMWFQKMVSGTANMALAIYVFGTWK